MLVSEPEAMQTVGNDSVITVETAAQDAASVAGLLVTTEAMVAEMPERKSAAAALAGHGLDGIGY